MLLVTATAAAPWAELLTEPLEAMAPPLPVAESLVNLHESTVAFWAT